MKKLVTATVLLVLLFTTCESSEDIIEVPSKVDFSISKVMVDQNEKVLIFNRSETAKSYKWYVNNHHMTEYDDQYEPSFVFSTYGNYTLKLELITNDGQILSASKKLQVAYCGN